MFIASGIGVIAFPWAKALYFTSIQNKVMRLWQEEIVRNESENSFGNENDDSVAVQVSISEESISIESIETDNGEWTEDVNPDFSLEYVKNNMEGIITIDKIKLRSPILSGATAYNLNISVCSAANAGKMGEPVNYILAGHKSRIYGRHFNRLAELCAGDKVVVENGTDTFEYTVEEIFSVTPEDTWVMESNGERTLTLITCDYRTNPTSRLIVRCLL